jgi:hypothetical protein
VEVKRTRLKPLSDKRRKVNAERARLMVEHFGPIHNWVCWFAVNRVAGAGP